MTKKILILSIVLTLYSCSEKRETINREEYQTNYRNANRKRYEIYNGAKNFRNNFLASIPDTIERKLWEEQIIHNFHQTRYIIDKIEEISYILMLQADSMPFYNMDTTGPQYLKNFDESKNTSSLLTHGLNKVIIQYLAKYDEYIADTIYNNPIRINKTINEFQATKFWVDSSQNINTISEFEVKKIQLYSELFAILDKRLNFYAKTYKDREKHSH